MEYIYRHKTDVSLNAFKIHFSTITANVLLKRIRFKMYKVLFPFRDNMKVMKH